MEIAFKVNYSFFPFEALAAILLIRAKPFSYFLVQNSLSNIPMTIPVKFESHWPKGSGGVSF